MKKKEEVYDMTKTDYLFYSDYLKSRSLKNKTIMIAKTKNSYLIGPLIDFNFFEASFYKRIKSNSIYNTKIYKKIFRRRSDILVKKYKKMLKSNQIIEIYKNGIVLTHTIIKVPGDDNEKK